MESDNSEEEKQFFNSAVLLEDLLDKKEFRKFRDSLQLPTVLEENDDLQTMFNMAQSQGKSKSKTLLKNLFEVLCCLAGELFIIYIYINMKLFAFFKTVELIENEKNKKQDCNNMSKEKSKFFLTYGS